MINQLISPAIAGIVAALVSYALWRLRFTQEFRTRKTAEFLEKQLSEFYGPMLMCIKQVRSITQLRYEEESLFQTYMNPEIEDDRKNYSELIEKHNKQHRESIMPIWEQMLDLFETKSHLAEPEVVEHYERFVKFTRLWGDHLEKPIGLALPLEAASQLSERYPEPVDFYNLTEAQYNEKKLEFRELTS
ncbi:MAG: hypothetical protein IH975_06815 [Nitrospinae bacterium]|nr:hypothetical protein [Nitrospinota bacterium]